LPQPPGNPEAPYTLPQSLRRDGDLWEKDFIFPTGRAWAEDLDYPDELANVPEAAVESFAGVANPWAMGRLAAGERVLDLGSGAGTDSLIAAQMVGDQGSVTGIDMTTEMLGRARAAAAEMGPTNVEFVESEAEQLPFPGRELPRGDLEWRDRPDPGQGRRLRRALPGAHTRRQTAPCRSFGGSRKRASCASAVAFGVSRCAGLMAAPPAIGRRARAAACE
jgi:SAM-dependent methyltransferase